MSVHFDQNAIKKSNFIYAKMSKAIFIFLRKRTSEREQKLCCHSDRRDFYLTRDCYWILVYRLQKKVSIKYFSLFLIKSFIPFLRNIVTQLAD